MRDLIDNEAEARAAYKAGEYFKSFILAQTLTEAVLRATLGGYWEEVTFGSVVKRYSATPYNAERGKTQMLPSLKLRKDLVWMRDRRNRVIHDLWFRRYDVVNRFLRASCSRAFLVYQDAFRRQLGLRRRRIRGKRAG